MLVLHKCMELYFNYIHTQSIPVSHCSSHAPLYLIPSHQYVVFRDSQLLNVEHHFDHWYLAHTLPNSISITSLPYPILSHHYLLVTGMVPTLYPILSHHYLLVTGIVSTLYPILSHHYLLVIGILDSQLLKVPHR